MVLLSKLVSDVSQQKRPLTHIWLVRHGQTDLNKARRMQGRSNVPLNETGIAQAQQAAAQVSDIRFDAVFSSPLNRAVSTGAIISRLERPEDVIIDPRLIETDFGPYEGRRYWLMGPLMTAYWALPEVFPAPKGVETIDSMVTRSRSFLKDLEETSAQRGFKNVLVSCHGGIIRALCGCLENRPKGILWRPKPHNCEFRVYSLDGGSWRRLR